MKFEMSAPSFSQIHLFSKINFVFVSEEEILDNLTKVCEIIKICIIVYVIKINPVNVCIIQKKEIANHYFVVFPIIVYLFIKFEYIRDLLTGEQGTSEICHKNIEVFVKVVLSVWRLGEVQTVSFLRPLPSVILHLQEKNL